ncbi:hypothetical protein GCM10023091_32900 [Ravibacter arvi]|uniref:ABC transporter ATPase n=1 Tax=Ravibacter arvi TaxID=2051041 RepID=A0ABP8M3B6_9BACT
MYIPFDEIDFEARIWIYQANKVLNHDQAGTLLETLKAATNNWDAHGKPLVASAKIFYNRFVVLAVDEANELPSGCAIDKSVSWMREAGIAMNIDFFDRSVAWIDGHGDIQLTALPAVRDLIFQEDILPNTQVFDNLVKTKAEWMTRWKVPAASTWLKKYFEEKNAQIPG